LRPCAASADVAAAAPADQQAAPKQQKKGNKQQQQGGKGGKQQGERVWMCPCLCILNSCHQLSHTLPSTAPDNSTPGKPTWAWHGSRSSSHASKQVQCCRILHTAPCQLRTHILRNSISPLHQPCMPVCPRCRWWQGL
jgi:hypothetical protein